MIYVNSVNVLPSGIVLYVGRSFAGATATVYPTSASNKTVTWHSENEEIAKVNETTGVISAMAPGTAKIYATSNDEMKKKDYITVTVVVPPSDQVLLNYIQLSKSIVNLDVGHTFVLSVALSPSNASDKTITWYSSNSNVATVNKGEITAIGGGTAKIYAYASDGGGACASCLVRVNSNDISVSCISINPPIRVMDVGEMDRFCATVLPINATDKSIVWISSDPTVARVDYYGGVVYALKSGTTEISAIAIDGSGVSGTCHVTVKEPIEEGMMQGLETIKRCYVRKDTSINDVAILKNSNGTNVVLEIGETVPLVSDTKIVANGRVWYRILYNGMIMHVTADDNSFKEVHVEIPDEPNGRTVRINTGNGTLLELRSVPSEGENVDIIGRIANNISVVVANEVPQNGIWYSVYGKTTSGHKLYGWCSGEYLQYKKTMLEVKYENGMLLRSAPSNIDFEIINSIYVGTSVLLLDENKIYNQGHYYYKVHYLNMDGYVLADDDTDFLIHEIWLPLESNGSNATGYIGDYYDFLDILAYYESSNRYDIEKGSYLGRYMMGSLALQEAGFQDENGNWTELALQYGVHDKNDFLENSEAQDIAVERCHRKVWKYLADFAVNKLGQKYQNVEITESGLLAGAHLVGAGELKRAINENEITTDGNNKAAHEYMESMANYDISQIK